MVDCQTLILVFLAYFGAFIGFSTQIPSCLENGATILGPNPVITGFDGNNCTLKDVITGKVFPASISVTNQFLWSGLDYGRYYGVACGFSDPEIVYTQPEERCENQVYKPCSCDALSISGQVDGTLSSECRENGVYSGEVSASGFTPSTIYAIFAEGECDSDSGPAKKVAKKSMDLSDCSPCGRYLGNIVTDSDGAYQGGLTLELKGSRRASLSFVATSLSLPDRNAETLFEEWLAIFGGGGDPPVHKRATCPTTTATLQPIAGKAASCEKPIPKRIAPVADKLKRLEVDYLGPVEHIIELALQVDDLRGLISEKLESHNQQVANLQPEEHKVEAQPLVFKNKPEFRVGQAPTPQVEETQSVSNIDASMGAIMGGVVLTALFAGFIAGRRTRHTPETTRLL